MGLEETGFEKWTGIVWYTMVSDKVLLGVSTCFCARQGISWLPDRHIYFQEK